MGNVAIFKGKLVKFLAKAGILIPKRPTTDRSLSPEQGETAFNTTDNKLEVWNGTEWTKLGSATGFTHPTTGSTFEDSKNNPAMTGTSNTAIGVDTGIALSTGINNTLIGNNAGKVITFGNDNVLIGKNAGISITYGEQNIAIGSSALAQTTYGLYNQAIGVNALTNITTGYNNVAIGNSAGSFYTSTSSNNTLINSFGALSNQNRQGTVVIGTDSSGTTSVSTANDDFVLGTSAHNYKLPGTIITNTKISTSSTLPALKITQTGTGNALLVEDSTSVDSTPFVIDQNGNVGIGQSSATEKLEVTGNIKTTGYVNIGGTATSPGANKINISSNNSANTFAVVGENGWIASVSLASLTSSKSYALPNNSGNIITSGDTGTVTSTMIATETIVNDDISLTAAIAGTKISPNFGSQTVTTTGSVTGSSLTASTGGVTVPTNQGLESASAGSTLNVGTGTNTSNINIGTGSGVQTVNIGTGTGTTTINIGAAGDTVAIAGTLTTVNTTNLDVKDNNITLNKGGLAGSGTNSGFTVEEAGTSVGRVLYDSTLASRFKLGPNGIEDEVVTASATQSLSNKTLVAPVLGTPASGTLSNCSGLPVSGITSSTTTALGVGSIELGHASDTTLARSAAGVVTIEGIEVVTVSGTQTLSNKTIGTVTAQSGTLSITGTGALKIPVGTTAQQPAGVQGMIRYDTTANAFQGYDGTTWSSIGGATTIDRITQTSHGFVVGDVLYLNGATYTKAIATAANTAEVAGMVSRYIDTNTFELTICGEVTGLSTTLSIGENYFLSASSPGAITAIEPTTVGYISLPVGVANSTTSIYFHVLRGTVVGAANARTTISVINSGATSVVDVTNYNSLKLEGELNVTRSSGGNQRAYYTVEATKNGAGTWQVSAGYTGDDINVGGTTALPTWDVSGTQLQVTMPTVTNFTSASLTYSLNAPAVGASLPLSVDSTALNIVADSPLSYRNKIINGDMRIAQRGTSTTSATSSYVYSLDRWRFYGQSTTGSATVSQQSFTIGQVDVPGDSEFFLRWNQTVTPGGVVALTQPVEGVRTLAGQTATLSFWAKAGSARSITTRLTQNFGTGGSTSVSVDSSSLSLTTNWQKFSIAFSVPSISGKTIGANNYLDILFLDSNLSTFTIDIAEVQLEVGSKASAFERRPIQQELALCQRYYEKSYNLSVAPGTAVASSPFRTHLQATCLYASINTTFAVRKRTSPTTVVVYDNVGVSGKLQADAASVNATTFVSESAILAYVNNVSLTANVFVSGNWTAEAEL